jgi:hypothetical protein
VLESNLGGSGGDSGSGYTDPLVAMGLFDPSSIRLADAGLVPGEEGSDEFQQEEETPVVDWESDENPYRQQVNELQTQIQETGYRANPQADLATQEVQIQQQGQAILGQFMAGPVARKEMSPEMAQIMVNLATQNALLDARHTAERQVLMPAAKREVAQRIAKEFSTKKTPVPVDDLMSEPTVEAMRTRAKMTVAQHRDGTFQARKNGNVDRAESSGGRRQVDETALNSMSPQQKIQYGLKHQRGAKGE